MTHRLARGLVSSSFSPKTISAAGQIALLVAAFSMGIAASASAEIVGSHLGGVYAKAFYTQELQKSPVAHTPRGISM
jgi:hypothetical protein